MTRSSRSVCFVVGAFTVGLGLACVRALALDGIVLVAMGVLLVVVGVRE